MNAAREESAAEALVAPHRLQRNVVLNLLGWILPAATALVAFPLVANGLGPDRFGLLALSWAAVGLFSLFDFGLGRALTRLVSRHLGAGDSSAIPDLVWSSAYLVLAAVGTLTLIGVLGAAPIADRFLHVPPAHRDEAIAVVRLLAIGLPALVHGVILRGVFEAAQRFDLINRLRVPLGLATYGGPLIVVRLGGGVVGAVGVVVGARILYWLAHWPLLNAVAPDLRTPRGFHSVSAAALLRSGGWITASNVLSPILGQADRLVIAAALPIAASGWYGTAAEVATKQWLFTAALQPVLFAALSAALLHAPERAAEMLTRATRVTIAVLFPAAAVLVACGAPALHWWMGAAYAPAAAAAMRWLAIGVFVNAMAQVPYAALQGGDESRPAALLHMVELPLYLLLLPLARRWYGLEGVAMACAARLSLDGLAMWWVAARRIDAVRHAAREAAVLGGTLTALLLLIAWRVGLPG